MGVGPQPRRIVGLSKAGWWHWLGQESAAGANSPLPSGLGFSVNHRGSQVSAALPKCWPPPTYARSFSPRSLMNRLFSYISISFPGLRRFGEGPARHPYLV